MCPSAQNNKPINRRSNKENKVHKIEQKRIINPTLLMQRAFVGYNVLVITLNFKQYFVQKSKRYNFGF
jgi:hypothetical protein